MKKITIILGIVFLQISLFAQIPIDSLKLYLPFNGNAIDASGNGNDGTVNGATLTTDRFGNANSAYYFDGSNSISVSGTESINPSLMSSYTISFWVNINTSTVADPRIVWAGPQSCGLDFLFRNATTRFLFSNDGCGTITYSNNTNINYNQWYFVSYILDYSLNENLVYINGNVDGNFTGSIIKPNSTLLTIGNWPQDFGGGWNGKIDDIRIYNRALNSTEVSSLYNESLCYETITVTDTLIINANITGYNPITFNNTIKIYPNPASDHLYIDTDNNSNGYEIKIINTLSQIVFQTTINQTQYEIDLNTWTGNGTYFVQFYNTDGNLIDVKKIIIQ